MEAPVAAIVVAADYSWVAPIIQAVGGLVTIILSGIAAIYAAKANNKSKEAKEQGVETHKTINSRMDELLKLTKEKAAMEATLLEKSAQRDRELAIKESTGNTAKAADTVLHTAADTAKQLVDDARSVALALVDAPIPVETRTEAAQAKQDTSTAPKGDK